LLPVVSRSAPNLLESAIISTPRTRAWMFSSVTSRGRPAKTGPSAASPAATTSAMAMVSKRSPRFLARMRASSRECWLEMAEGRETPITFSGPNASAAITATSAESMPPESATRACLEAAFGRVIAQAEHERFIHVLPVGLREGRGEGRFWILDFGFRIEAGGREIHDP
jgi:hypothetical protein